MAQPSIFQVHFQVLEIPVKVVLDQVACLKQSVFVFFGSSRNC